MGRSFSLRLLDDLESATPDAALDVVEEAERAHLVSAEHAGSVHCFEHDVVWQTLAETAVATAAAAPARAWPMGAQF